LGYQPLGPFLSKNFGSTLSPWVVTMEALAPFRAPLTRPAEDPDPLPYLNAAQDRVHGALDIELEVWLQTAAMREASQSEVRLTRSNASEAAYWTPAQLVAHHTVGGCNLQPGDLFGSGTLSRPRPDQARFVAGTDTRRQAADHASQWRDPHLSPRWRHAYAPRLLRPKRCASPRFRRLQRDRLVCVRAAHQVSLGVVRKWDFCM